MHILKECFKKELLEYEDRAEKSSGKFPIQELDRIQKLSSIIKNLDKIEMYEEYGEEQSQESYRGGNSYGESRYSERRGRDRMGRYTSRDGYSGEDVGRNGYSMRYSRDEGKHKMIEELEKKMKNASSSERETIEMCLEFLEKCD